MNVQGRRVALFGATGTVGRAAAQALLDAGHEVVSYGRRDPGIAGLHHVEMALVSGDESATSPPAALSKQQPDAILSCLASRKGAPKDAWAVEYEANLAILRAAEALPNKPHFILLSAICVQKPRLAFQHAKLAFEEALIASPLPHTIIRPTALFKSLTGQVARVQAGKPYLMFGDGRLTACVPISDRDLGRFITQCLEDPDTRHRILPIGGPGPALTPRDMGQMLFDKTGQPPRFRSVPPGLLKAIAAGLATLGKIHPPSADRAEFARIGHYYGTESMLLWDPVRGAYDADATPRFGSDRLSEHFDDLIAGRAVAERGDHAVF